MNIPISVNFKKMASKAILSILLFIVTYLVLVLLSVSLTIGLGYAAVMLVVMKPMFLTLMLGLGMMSGGIFILLFLFKFITKKHQVDRSRLHEITSADEPLLFSLIQEVVAEVGTEFPKKVYLSHEVNASVFYNSTFWSMIFPVRKNLQIGVGLINSVTTSELKAILAHEFGHFSQRSMKVGSYVYNVNQVIHDLLFENESYNQILGEWANASGYFKLFAELAVKVIQGIQWILRKVYVIVNLNYLALSREMEFHADEVAANVTGQKPMIAALSRLGLASDMFDSVLDYYSSKVESSIKTNNLYTQHGWLMNYIGAENNMVFESELPHVSKEDMSRFNKSKLIIKDQWASHPSTEERIERLKSLKLPDKLVSNTLASTLLKDQVAIQESLTEALFKPVEYNSTPVTTTIEQFIDDYTRTFNEARIHRIYNGYYDTKDLSLPVCNTDLNDETADTFAELFSDTAVELIYTANSMRSDIEILRQIAEGGTRIKTFDYDGQRHTAKQAATLVADLTEELELLEARIGVHDEKIYKSMLHFAKQGGKEQEFRNRCNEYNKLKQDFDRRLALYNNLVDQTLFLQHNTPFETIEQNFGNLVPLENELKKEIREIIADEEHQSGVTSEIKEGFANYLNNTETYFFNPEYNQHAVDLLSTAINNFYFVVSNSLFKSKKVLLEYQASLEQHRCEPELV